MAKAKLYQDYTDLAEQRGFTFIGPFPRNVRTPVEWRCNHCGRVRKLPYNVFKYVQPACRCRTSFGFSREDYDQFAKGLGIEWIGSSVPRTIHESTQWRIADGEIITASRHNLSRSASISHEKGVFRRFDG